MKRMLLALMLLTVPLGAQEQKAEAAAKPAPAPNQQKVFILKYADPENLRQLLSVFGGGLIPNAEMHALAVTAPLSMMPAIEEAIGRLDVPSAAPKNFDFTVDLVVGTDAENPVSASIPKDLDSVIAQLKGAFPFKSYRLLDVPDTAHARGEAGERPEFRRRGAGWIGDRDSEKRLRHQFRKLGRRRDHGSSRPAAVHDPVPLRGIAGAYFDAAT